MAEADHPLALFRGVALLAVVLVVASVGVVPGTAVVQEGEQSAVEQSRRR